MGSFGVKAVHIFSDISLFFYPLQLVLLIVLFISPSVSVFKRLSVSTSNALIVNPLPRGYVFFMLQCAIVPGVATKVVVRLPHSN